VHPTAQALTAGQSRHRVAQALTTTTSPFATPLTFKRAELPSKECVACRNKASGTERGVGVAQKKKPKTDLESGPHFATTEWRRRVSGCVHDNGMHVLSMMYLFEASDLFKIKDVACYHHCLEQMLEDIADRSTSE